MSKYILNRDVSEDDEEEFCGETLKKGSVVYSYSGYTYGCIGGGVAVSLEDGKEPFFELPYNTMTLASELEN